MLAKTQSDIVSQMQQALLLSEPDLDTSVGSVIRKVLDAVGEVISETYVDQYLIDYQYDVDAKTGTDLDDFVKLFGFSRFAAKRATGMITFERSAPATQDISINVNTQVSTEGSPTIVVATIVPATLVTGDTSITVPAQALVGGITGNVSANSLRRQVTPIQGINSFTNSTSFTGGADAESDDQLRERFKRTVFRNLAGTEQMFTAIALDNQRVTQANVVGASKRHREQIEIVGGNGISTLQDTKYVYPNSSVFGPNIDTGDILTPGLHYTFNDSLLQSLDGNICPDGIYDLEYEYVPLASRNDPLMGITNRVDIYVNGTEATSASDVAIFRNDQMFNNNNADPLFTENFHRVNSDNPQVGNYFIRLAFTPVLDASLNDQITIGAHTYVEGTDYFMVNDVTATGGTIGSLSGLEWVSAANGGTNIPDNLSAVSVDYVYNAVPRDVETAVRAWRLMTTDVKVHQANAVLLNFYLAIIYSAGFVQSSVQPTIENAINDYISNIGFNGVVQVSDILQVVHNVSGVDAVRFLTSTDNYSDDAGNAHYAIQQVSGIQDDNPDDPDNPIDQVLTTYATSGQGQARRAEDVLLSDDQVPVFNAVHIVPKAQNTFGSV